MPRELEIKVCDDKVMENCILLGVNSYKQMKEWAKPFVPFDKEIELKAKRCKENSERLEAYKEQQTLDNINRIMKVIEDSVKEDKLRRNHELLKLSLEEIKEERKILDGKKQKLLSRTSNFKELNRAYDLSEMVKTNKNLENYKNLREQTEKELNWWMDQKDFAANKGTEQNIENKKRICEVVEFNKKKVLENLEKKKQEKEDNLKEGLEIRRLTKEFEEENEKKKNNRFNKRRELNSENEKLIDHKTTLERARLKLEEMEDRDNKIFIKAKVAMNTDVFDQQKRREKIEKKIKHISKVIEERDKKLYKTWNRHLELMDIYDRKLIEEKKEKENEGLREKKAKELADEWQKQNDAKNEKIEKERKKEMRHLEKQLMDEEESRRIENEYRAKMKEMRISNNSYNCWIAQLNKNNEKYDRLKDIVQMEKNKSLHASYVDKMKRMKENLIQEAKSKNYEDCILDKVNLYK